MEMGMEMVEEMDNLSPEEVEVVVEMMVMVEMEVEEMIHLHPLIMDNHNIADAIGIDGHM